MLDLLYRQRMRDPACGTGKCKAIPHSVKPDMRPRDLYRLLLQCQKKRPDFRSASASPAKCISVNNPPKGIIQPIIVHDPFHFRFPAGLIRQKGMKAHRTAAGSLQHFSVHLYARSDMHAKRVLQLHLHLLLAAKTFIPACFLSRLPLFHKAADASGTDPHTKINDKSPAAGIHARDHPVVPRPFQLLPDRDLFPGMISAVMPPEACVEVNLPLLFHPYSPHNPAKNPIRFKRNITTR